MTFKQTFSRNLHHHNIYIFKNKIFMHDEYCKFSIKWMNPDQWMPAETLSFHQTRVKQKQNNEKCSYYAVAKKRKTRLNNLVNCLLESENSSMVQRCSFIATRISRRQIRLKTHYCDSLASNFCTLVCCFETFNYLRPQYFHYLKRLMLL